EKAQELLEDLELSSKKRGEVAIGWAIVAVATQLKALNKELRGRV
ncbi:unnamed protein product, partial [marine sediment metagenome]